MRLQRSLPPSPCEAQVPSHLTHPGGPFGLGNPREFACMQPTSPKERGRGWTAHLTFSQYLSSSAGTRNWAKALAVAGNQQIDSGQALTLV